MNNTLYSHQLIKYILKKSFRTEIEYNARRMSEYYHDDRLQLILSQHLLCDNFLNFQTKSFGYGLCCLYKIEIMCTYYIF